MENITWISLGENCVPQMIINKLGIKTIISPYSWAFSSIDHIINLQEEDFLIKDYEQTTCPIWKEKYSVHKTSKNSDDSFFVETGKTLAFRHHDFFSNNEDYEKIKKRMNRHKSLDGDGIVFLHYYRFGETPNCEYVRSRLEYFLNKYYPKAKILMFYKVYNEQMGIRLIQYKNNVFEFEIKTTAELEYIPEKLYKEMLEPVSQSLRK
jgi:hypothetical protein